MRSEQFALCPACPRSGHALQTSSWPVLTLTHSLLRYIYFGGWSCPVLADEASWLATVVHTEIRTLTFMPPSLLSSPGQLPPRHFHATMATVGTINALDS